MIEAAIAGKGVYTVLAPEFNQGQTIHFHYLLAEHGGFLHVAGSLDEHFEQLTAGLANEEAESDRARSFVASFVRPGGIEQERDHDLRRRGRGAGRAPCAHAEPAPSWPMRAALTPLAALSSAALAARVGKAALTSWPGRRSGSGETRVGTVASMKFVFSLLHPGYLRHYREPIRLLAERGHEVHVALSRLEKDPGDLKLIEQLAADNPNVTLLARALPAATRRLAPPRLAHARADRPRPLRRPGVRRLAGAAAAHRRQVRLADRLQPPAQRVQAGAAPQGRR